MANRGVFEAGRWVDAFVHVCGNKIAPVLEGLKSLQALYDGLSPVQTYELRGSADADKIDRAMKEALKDDASETPENLILQYSRRTLYLLIKEGYWDKTPQFLTALMSRVEDMQGILRVDLDAAAMPDGNFIEKLEKALTEQTGANKADIKVHLKPELIGGYRLKMKGELFDFSIQTQLKMMGAHYGGF